MNTVGGPPMAKSLMDLTDTVGGSVAMVHDGPSLMARESHPDVAGSVNGPCKLYNVK
jgi:hypothetical protein